MTLIQKAISILNIELSEPIAQNEIGETFPTTVLVTRSAVETLIQAATQSQPTCDRAKALEWLRQKMKGGDECLYALPIEKTRHMPTIEAALSSPPAVDKSVVEAVSLAAKRFRFYVEQHMAKTPPDTMKAENNREYAEMMEKVLALLGGNTGEK